MIILPSPPTDIERDYYFPRRMWLLIPMLLLVPIGVGYSAFRFSIAEVYFIPYLFVALIATAWAAITLRVGLLARDKSLSEHRARVRHGCSPSSVDVFLPVCGEPLAVLRNTWEYVARLSWDGPIRIYVLDDKDIPEVAAMAREFGFEYIARRENGHMKKAGNLMYAYRRTHGEFIAIFDADFCPRDDYLYELMPYFDDDIGIVQSPQHFRVHEGQKWIERGAGAIQEFFYRVVQVARDHHGGAICVGTCAIYRRAALDDNNGPAQIEHSEDVHTGIELRRHGWGLSYIPTCVSTGACPDDLDAFFRQQYRWCMGSMSLLQSRSFWRLPMGFVTRLCYVSGFAYYIATALAVSVGPIVPLALLTVAPERVHAIAYVPLLLGFTYMYVLFPLWHRCRYGPETMSVKMLCGWAHLFALVDVARRRPMGWSATGAKPKTDHRVRVLYGVITIYAGLGLLWVGLASYRASEGRPWDFAPMMLTGALYFAVMARPIARPSLRYARRGLRAVTIGAALAFIAAVPATAHGYEVGVVIKPKDVGSWTERVGARPQAVALYDSLDGDPAPELRETSRQGIRRVFITLSPRGWTSSVGTQGRTINARVASGDLDRQLIRYARKLAEFRGRVYIRYCHEMNGFWFPWSFEADGSHGGRDFIRAWRRVYRLFHRLAPNSRLVWSPNVGNPNLSNAGRWAKWEPYWPGRKFVDAVGISTINFGKTDVRDWKVGSQAGFWPYMTMLRRMTNRPVWATEVNTNIDYALDWFPDLFARARSTSWFAGIVISQVPTHGGIPEKMNWDISADRRLTKDLRNFIKRGRY